MIDDEVPTLNLTITFELPGGPGTTTIALGAVLNVLNHFEREGLRPYRTTIDLDDLPTI